MLLELSGRQFDLRRLDEMLSADEQDFVRANYEMVPAIIQTRQQLYCQRCSNQTAFEYLNEKKGYYCLNCLALGRLTQQDQLVRISAKSSVMINDEVLTWQGQLSSEQQRASDELVASLTDTHLIHVIHAVTGAGKTEMIFEVIAKVLQQGGRVALVSPRVDVCLELAPRIKAAFQSIDIITMYGDTEDEFRYTSIVISTAHQLWKFYHAFDLIIVDEIDAFPLTNDATLHFGIQQALKVTGKLIYLTATPDAYLESLFRNQQAIRTVLPARFHRQPLPEPTFQWCGDWQSQIRQRKERKLLRIIRQFLMIDGTKIIFMPDIQLAEQLYEWLKMLGLAKQMAVVHAQDALRKEKVQQLRQGLLTCVISTTILERGVTFTNCHVLIVGAEHRVFTASALVQMSGRVGRSSAFPSGEVIFSHFGVSFAMVKARRAIRQMNQKAKERQLLDVYSK